MTSVEGSVQMKLVENQIPETNLTPLKAQCVEFSDI